MKKLFALTLVLCLLLAGCGAESKPTEPAPTAEPLPTGTEEAPLAAQDPEPIPTQATEAPTEEATQPAAPIPVDMDADTQYNINIFLSNFSEQWFAEHHPITGEPMPQGFDGADPDPALLVHFAQFYNRINSWENYHTDQAGGCYYVTYDRVVENCRRFFGLELSYEDFQSCGLDIRGDRACMPLADGDTYMEMTVADTMTGLGDGTYEVEFTIYTVDWEYADVGGGITRKEIYSLSGTQAAESVHLEQYKTGTALVRDYVNGDFVSYQLIRYQVDMQDTSAYISQDEALEIAYRFWEVQPGETDPETGFPLTVDCLQTPEEGEPVYRMSLRWLVDNSHWSTLDTLTIDAVTGETSQP